MKLTDGQLRYILAIAGYEKVDGLDLTAPPEEFPMEAHHYELAALIGENRLASEGIVLQQQGNEWVISRASLASEPGVGRE